MSAPRILIISASIERSPLAFPMGALSIYTAIRTDERLMNAFDTSFRHFHADTDDPAWCAQEDARTAPDILAVSLYLFNREWMYRYIEHFRDRCPEVLIIAGGPDVISSPQELITRGVRYLIIGEGETTMRRVLTQLREGREPEGAGIYSARRPFPVAAYEKDLDALPSPLLFLHDSLGTYPGLLWEMTRGCPFRCAFCAESRETGGCARIPLNVLRRNCR